MSNITFITLTSDNYGHCVKFKSTIRPSGQTGMNELLSSIRKKYPNVVIKMANIDQTGNYNLNGIPTEFYNLSDQWYPSFYLFDSNKFNSGVMDGGLVMGGYVSGNNVVLDGTKRSTDPKIIFSWVESKLGNNTTNNVTNNNNTMINTNHYSNTPIYAQYEQRLYNM